MDRPPKLFTSEFLSLNLILVATFCNVSVFYSFYHYLGGIGIPVAWRGLLVGLEPMTAFALRLFIIPWLHARNALLVLVAGLILLTVASCAYLWALSVPALIALRIFHGGVFVLLTSAVIALAVQFIPPEKSGQGFGAVSVAAMIPYAIIPPLTEAFLPYVASEAVIYAGISGLNLVALSLLALLYRRLRRVLHGMDGTLMRRPRLKELRENFTRRAVVILLASGLLIYLVHATIFYFVKDLALQIGIGDAGVFFAISMAAMIAVRAFGGVFFDRISKQRLLQIGIAALVLLLFLLPQIHDRALFCLLAAVYGLAMGVVLPMLNALLFTASPPALRGLNTNMTLFTMDAGYFLLPYAGGTILALGVGFDVLFFIGAGFAFMALLLGLLPISVPVEEKADLKEQS